MPSENPCFREVFDGHAGIAAPAAVAHVLELNLDAVGRVEQDLRRTVTRRRRPRTGDARLNRECRPC
jgi:hypothetical protein